MKTVHYHTLVLLSFMGARTYVGADEVELVTFLLISLSLSISPLNDFISPSNLS